MAREIQQCVCLDLPYLNKAPLLHVKREKTVKRDLTREQMIAEMTPEEKELFRWIKQEFGGFRLRFEEVVK